MNGSHEGSSAGGGPSVCPPETAVGAMATLIVSTFRGHLAASWRARELVGALAANLQNPYFASVLSLHEGDEDSVLALRTRLADLVPDEALRKLQVQRVDKQPSYQRYFQAAQSLNRTVAIISNSDIVYDATIRLPLRELALISRNGVSPNQAYVLSVTGTPHAYRAETRRGATWRNYSALVGRECPECRRASLEAGSNSSYCEPACDVIHQGRGAAIHPLHFGKSWDAFILLAPMPWAAFDKFMRLFNLVGSWRRGIFMNQVNAENRVGTFLATAGFKLFNPCRFVRVEHWDCTGNKTHHPDRVMGFAYSMRRPTALQKAIDSGKVVAPLIGPLAGTPGAVVNPASTHYLAQLELARSYEHSCQQGRIREDVVHERSMNVWRGMPTVPQDYPAELERATRDAAASMKKVRVCQRFPCGSVWTTEGKVMSLRNLPNVTSADAKSAPVSERVVEREVRRVNNLG